MLVWADSNNLEFARLERDTMVCETVDANSPASSTLCPMPSCFTTDETVPPRPSSGHPLEELLGASRGDVIPLETLPTKGAGEFCVYRHLEA